MKLINVGLKENSRSLCPKCYTHDNGETSTKEVGSDSQYICYDATCVKDNGDEVQFFVKNDEEKKFPYDQIFPSRELKEFYTKSYIKN